jgi:hypothetical protein
MLIVPFIVPHSAFIVEEDLWPKFITKQMVI